LTLAWDQIDPKNLILGVVNNKNTTAIKIKIDNKPCLIDTGSSIHLNNENLYKYQIKKNSTKIETIGEYVTLNKYIQFSIPKLFSSKQRYFIKNFSNIMTFL